MSNQQAGEFKLSLFSKSSKKFRMSRSRSSNRAKQRQLMVSSEKRIAEKKGSKASGVMGDKKLGVTPSQRLKRIRLSKSRFSSGQTPKVGSRVYLKRMAENYKSLTARRPVTQSHSRRQIERNMSATKSKKKTDISTEEASGFKAAWGAISNNFATSRISSSQMGYQTQRNKNVNFFRTRLRKSPRMDTSELASSTVEENMTLSPKFEHIMSRSRMAKPQVDKKYAIIDNCKDQIKLCASKLNEIVHSPKVDIQEGRMRKINIGALKAVYFRIPCYGKQSPLTLKIVQDRLKPIPDILTIYTSFHCEFPDGEENDLLFSEGKNKIYAPKNSRTFNIDYCYFSLLSMTKASYCCVYYFNNTNPVSLVWDKDLGSYKTSGGSQVDVKLSRNEEKYFSISERNDAYIRQCLDSEEGYQKFEEKTNNIFYDRDESFQRRKIINERKQSEVKKYYKEVIPKGMTVQEFKLIMAKKRKEEKDEKLRKRMIFIANKWNYLRQESYKAEIIQKKIKMQRNYVKTWVGFKTLHYGIRKIHNAYIGKRYEVIKAARSMVIANKVYYMYRKRELLRGTNVTIRTHNTIRHSLVFSSEVLASKCESRAKQIFTSFIKDLKCKRALSVSFIDYWTQILKVRHRFLHIIKMTSQRMEFLIEKWEEQKQVLIEEYEKEILNNKSKHAKKMRKKIKGISDGLRYICLKLYLNQCRTEHNIAFFEWRKNHKEEAKELITKYSEKLKKKIEEEDKKVEDKNELHNELLGVNLNKDTNDSLSSLNISASAPTYSKKKRAKKTGMKRLPILDRLKIMDDPEEHFEIDDLNMIGIKSNAKPRRFKKRTTKQTKLKIGKKRATAQNKINYSDPKDIDVGDFFMTNMIRNMNDKASTKVPRKNRKTYYKSNRNNMPKVVEENHHIYKEETLQNTGTGYKLPPRFLWVPSNHLIRVAIIRTCFIKDIDKLLEDNMKSKIEVTAEGIEVVKPTMENVIKHL
ncbi:unnamed protein product [Moneuplotes crassus]|uniref:Uncharacterized protein n=1 Tax=Euplotes crassus TaxID=5936 RepID=A0AAD1XIJ9_EUPCR|nr:unnamed protein product [Moneuplotes crassus]